MIVNECTALCQIYSISTCLRITMLFKSGLDLFYCLALPNILDSTFSTNLTFTKLIETVTFQVSCVLFV